METFPVDQGKVSLQFRYYFLPFPSPILLFLKPFVSIDFGFPSNLILYFYSFKTQLTCAPVHKCCHIFGLRNSDKHPVRSCHKNLVVIYATL